MKLTTVLAALITISVCMAPANAAFDVETFLAGFTPGTPYEQLPHGVPTNYNWAAHSLGGTPTRPDGTVNMNLWGQVYVNTTNVHAVNVRVEVKGSQLWFLYGSTWTLGYRTDNLGGGAWTEDFRSGGGPFDMKTEPDGGRSFIPAPGYNSHFWPSLSHLPIPVVPRAVLAVAFTRLVLENVSGPDNRSSSAYIVNVGADWRAAGGSCPNNICTAVGHGVFIKPNNNWRTAVFSTMSDADLSSLPMPPDSIFKMPDGTYPDNGITGANIDGGKRNVVAQTASRKKVVMFGGTRQLVVPAGANGRLVTIHGRVLGAGAQRASEVGLKPGVYLVERK